MKLKKIMSVNLIIIVLIVNCFITPVNARNISREHADPFEIPPLTYTEKYNYGYSNNRISFTVLSNNTKVRKEPNERSDVIRTLDAGTEVIIIGAAENRHGNTWFILENDEGYIFSKKLAFNIKENSLIEYQFFKHIDEACSDADKAFLTKAATLVGLFTQQGNQYFENLLGRYGSNTEYIIQTKDSCYTIPASSMKYVYYAYIAARIGFDEKQVLLSASNGESLAYVLTESSNKLNGSIIDAIEIIVGGILELSPFVDLKPWVDAAFASLSLSDFMDIDDSLAFYRKCQKELCITESQRKLISFGYNLGLEDGE